MACTVLSLVKIKEPTIFIGPFVSTMKPSSSNYSFQPNRIIEQKKNI